jgi:phage recombination protein Bet
MNAVTPAGRAGSIVERISARYGITDSTQFWNTLKSTVFKTKDGGAPSNEEMMTLLVVAEQYGLNPFTREIYAFPDKKAGIVPVVGVDGWIRIVNSHAQFDGIEFQYSDKLVQIDEHHKPAPEWCMCIIHRKDRALPIKVQEYLDEVYRPPFTGRGRNNEEYQVNGPWQTHTKRFLRHKALIQCARVAFGFSGIHDEDEAEDIAASASGGRIIDHQPNAAQGNAKPAATAKLDALSAPKAEAQANFVEQTQQRQAEPVRQEAMQQAAPKPAAKAEAKPQEQQAAQGQNLSLVTLDGEIQYFDDVDALRTAFEDEMERATTIEQTNEFEKLNPTLGSQVVGAGGDFGPFQDVLAEARKALQPTTAPAAAPAASDDDALFSKRG